MSRPYLVVVTAKTCGACKNFHSREWTTLQNALTVGGKVELKKIEFETTSSNGLDTTVYPTALSKLIQWFPILVLVSERSWKANGPALEAVVFSGRVNSSGIAQQASPMQNPTAQNIIRWIDEQLAAQPFLRAAASLPSSPAPVAASGSGTENVNVCSHIRILPHNRK